MSTWIDNPQTLSERLARWAGQPTVALDTEFIRERTYYPQLALVQLAIPGEILLVDPLVPGMDDALRPLLLDPAVTKLMHSASEDLQALQRGCAALPAPLFDTQVAAALCGLGSGLGYQKLVEQVTGIQLAKGETRSDWLRRPLSESQHEYAADDVRHLHAVHELLDNRLTELNRHAWLQADADRALRNAVQEGEDPGRTYGRAQRAVAGRRGPGPPVPPAALARHRGPPQRPAQELDHRQRTGGRAGASSAARFQRIQRHAGSPSQGAAPFARRAVERLTAPIEAEERAIPLLKPESYDKQTLKAMQEAVITVAQAHGLPEGLLCARRHLESLLEGRGWPEALNGWRRELLEPALAPLIPAA